MSNTFNSMSTKASRIEFLGCPIDAITMEESLNLIESRIENDQFTQHVVVNVAKLVQMQTDSALRQSVVECDIVNADGMGVVWGARLAGSFLPERVAGIDLFLRLLARAEERSYGVYFLGATQAVLDSLLLETKIRFPKLMVSGSHHGFFWDNEAVVVESIRRSGARLLFVAISSPLKETFISRWRDELGVSFVMGVGGSFDVVAGITKRAPMWMQRSGLEWFFRLLQEPRRMWRRYLFTNLRFAYLLFSELVLGSKSSS